jgi:hypothetical protein
MIARWRRLASMRGWGVGDVPFWSDDFDMDLPKIFPDARRLLGDLGDIELVTVGKPDKNGRLNHPAVWNGDHSMLSFFGFKRPRKPDLYWSSDGLVRCTAWEAFRDAWSHNYLIQVEQRPVWDTGPLWPHFQTIMYRVRGWGHYTAEQEQRARRVALRSYYAGVRAFGRVVESDRHNIDALADAPARARRG